MKINVYHVSKSTWISGWNNVMPSWVGGLYHTGVEVWGRCVVRDSNSGHQLLFTPAKWCPIFASGPRREYWFGHNKTAGNGEPQCLLHCSCRLSSVDCPTKDSALCLLGAWITEHISSGGPAGIALCRPTERRDRGVHRHRWPSGENVILLTPPPHRY